MSIDVFPASVLNATLWNGQSMPLSIAGGGTDATTAAEARTNLGLGTMSTQNANAVAITGGTVTGLVPAPPTPALHVSNISGDNASAFYSELISSGGTNRYALFLAGDAPSLMRGSLSIDQQLAIGEATPAALNGTVTIYFNKSVRDGTHFHQRGDDAGSGSPIIFRNITSAVIGSITTTASATAFNTSSDVRLKHAIEKLVGSLDLIRVLNPIGFRWNANNEHGEGFLAHELQHIIPAAVTGEPDALNDDGSIKPQQVDHSKLIPRLVGAIQELLQRVEALEAQLQGA